MKRDTPLVLVLNERIVAEALASQEMCLFGERDLLWGHRIQPMADWVIFTTNHSTSHRQQKRT